MLNNHHYVHVFFVLLPNKYLKGKMVRDGIELVSITNHFEFQTPDDKQRAADALDVECAEQNT